MPDAVVVRPSARRRFSPQERAECLSNYISSGPQFRDDETGVVLSAFTRWDTERVLLVMEVESESTLYLLTPEELLEQEYPRAADLFWAWWTSP